jgi:signal peptidase II
VKKKLLIVGLVVLLILTLDQILKIWVKTSFTVYDEPVNLIGSWFRLMYIENQGMAFGTTFGASIWAKLALSLFRIGAIIGLAIYWYKQAKKQVKLEFLIAVGLIFAGATGNLIDSMFYDFIFKFDPCLSFNFLEGSGIKADCGIFGQQEIRHSGFLFGNVVDMFQFNLTWPSWVPWLGGGDVFPAIWNIADASISSGVIMILIRQRKYFPKEKGTKAKVETHEETTANTSQDSTN